MLDISKRSVSFGKCLGKNFKGLESEVNKQSWSNWR